MSSPIINYADYTSVRGRYEQRPHKRTLESGTTFYLPPLSRPGDRYEEGYIPGLEREYTAWDVYNNEARKVDTELVKEWRDSLNSLLVFAAIFAAVLTAFIIESKKMLEPDWSQLLFHVAVFTVNNAANLTNVKYTPPDLRASNVAVSINCLLFASLGTSLVAALASVIALQWVANYDAATTRGGYSPEDRAKRRQFRFAGVVSWNMSEIIAALPLLLYSSVILFWAGAIQWMINLHHIVGYVVVIATIIGLLFYGCTTLIGTLYVSSPFRTPLSRGLFLLYQQLIRWVPLLVSVACLICLWVSFHVLLVLSLTLRQLISKEKQRYLRARMSDLLDLAENSIHWIKTRWSKKVLTSRSREDQAAEQDATLREQALTWLGSQLTVSTESSYRQILLLREVVSHSSQQSLSAGFFQAPWLGILDSLGWKYLRKVLNGTLAEEDYDAVHILLQASVVPEIRREITPNRQLYSIPLSQSCFTSSETREFRIKRPENMTYLLSRDMVVPSRGSKQELEATFKLIKWRNSEKAKSIEIWMDIFAHKDSYSPEYIQSCLHSFARLVPALCNEQRDYVKHPSSWLLSATNEDKHIQVVQALVVSDVLLQQNADAGFHCDLIYLISKTLEASRENWPSTPRVLDEISGRLAGIDPCLALLGGNVCGVYVSLTGTITRVYIEEHARSLLYVQELLYKKLSLADPQALWRLRAAAWTNFADPCGIVGEAFRQPEHLSHLQLVFRHATHCYGHRMTPQHIIYHLCNASRVPHGYIQGDTALFGNFELKGKAINAILAFLAFSDEDSPTLSIDDDINPACMTQIRRMCNAVKEKPYNLLVLLTDLACERARRQGRPEGFGLILKAVEDAAQGIQDESTIHLLRPLLQALRGLQINMAHGKLGSADRREMIDLHADRICGLLEARSSATTISSSSHHQILSCARGGTFTRPATGLLSMYVDP